jgi:hypothetical protein
MLDHTRRAVTHDGVHYAPGWRFLVVAEGLRISGMVYEGRSSWGGWGQKLHAGDVLTCTGSGPGFGMDPGIGVEWTTPASIAARASHCDLSPQLGGPFAYRPRPGFLAPVLDRGVNWQPGPEARQQVFYVYRTREGRTEAWGKWSGANPAAAAAEAWRGAGWTAVVVRTSREVRAMYREWARRAYGEPGEAHILSRSR